jgi:hypothetical protein
MLLRHGLCTRLTASLETTSDDDFLFVQREPSLPSPPKELSARLLSERLYLLVGCSCVSPCACALGGPS